LPPYGLTGISCGFVEVQTDIKMACDITSAFLKRQLVERMEVIIDEAQKVTHSKFSDELDAFLADTKCLKKIKAPDGASFELVDWAFPPIIQSGGRYDLKPSAASDDNVLHFGTILCAIGTRYNSYCSNIARTFLISPTKVGSPLFLSFLFCVGRDSGSTWMYSLCRTKRKTTNCFWRSCRWSSAR